MILLRVHLLSILAGLLLALGGCGGSSGSAGAGSPEAAPAAPESAGSEAAASEPAEAPPADPLGLPNEREALEGVRTGGQADAAALEQAAERGYTTVISLRTEGEKGYDEAREAETVQQLGMQFVSIPVAGAEGVTEENARALSEALAEAEGPVVLHCGSGNRAGALLALRAYFEKGKGVEEAMGLGRGAGLTSLEPTVRQVLTEHCEASPDRAC